MQTNHMLAATTLAAILALTGSVEAGQFADIFNPGPGGDSQSYDPIGDVVGQNGDSPDFDGIFNPKPDPVINKDIGLGSQDVRIYKKLDLNPARSEGTGKTNAAGTHFKTARLAKLDIGLKVKCLVAGTPVEFPDDLLITNAGSVAVPAGAQIQWRVATAGFTGVAVLGKTLNPGKSIKVTGVLPGGAEAGTACAIVAIGH